MAQYLLTVKNPAGRTVTELLDADSAKAAIETLQERGYENVVLHTDDFMAKDAKPLELNPLITARDLAKNRTRSGLQRLLANTARSYVANWKLMALIAVAFTLRRFNSWPWGWGEALIAAGLLLPALFALVAHLPSMQYDRLLEADSWRRWDEVLRLLPSLRGKLAPYGVAWHESKALAGLGRLDEALNVVLPFANNGEISQAKFWSLLMASVYRSSNQRDMALSALEKALEHAPDDPAVLLDLAGALLDEQRDVGRAKELWQHAMQQPMSDLAQKFALAVEGMIALAEGHAQLAVERLETAFRAQQAFAKANATAAAAADIMEARLALAQAKAGDLEAARKHFRRAEPRLRALQHDKLLARCERVIGSVNSGG
ncbi:MAG TPA: hypothetical protein VMV10_28200 [Pirellulales bacterium]|nr:hypothetical protein [Pirellulales bacterium]